jgi:hypothetical protein
MSFEFALKFHDGIQGQGVGNITSHLNLFDRWHGSPYSSRLV